MKQTYLSDLSHVTRDHAQAAEAHQLLLQGKAHQMPQKQRSAWSQFIMSQWFRTLDELRYFKEAMKLVLTARDEALNARHRRCGKKAIRTASRTSSP